MYDVRVPRRLAHCLGPVRLLLSSLAFAIGCCFGIIGICGVVLKYTAESIFHLVVREGRASMG
jgi:hypothetical protein